MWPDNQSVTTYKNIFLPRYNNPDTVCVNPVLFLIVSSIVLPMNKEFTPVIKKTVKREKPSRRIIDNILNYSKSLSVIVGIAPQPLLFINN